MIHRRVPPARDGKMETGQTVCGISGSNHQVAFMTTPVTIQGPCGKVVANAFLDSGSSCSYITADLVKKVGLPTREGSLEATVLGGQKLDKLKQQSTIKIDHGNSNSSSEFSVWVLPQIMDSLTPVDWAEQQRLWPHLADVKPACPPVPTQVDILIGLNAPQLHTPLEERFAYEGGPVARKTSLGWIAFGQVCSTTAQSQDQSMLAMADTPLTEVVSKFWQLESVGMQPKASSYFTPDERAAETMTANSLQHNGTRFVTRIPWKDAHGPKLEENSMELAKHRLGALFRMFQKKPDVHLKYSKVLETYLEKKYIQPVLPSTIVATGNGQWFLPHFPVIREGKETTKVRIVFDGSAQVNGVAINDLMYTGPKLHCFASANTPLPSRQISRRCFFKLSSMKKIGLIIVSCGGSRPMIPSYSSSSAELCLECGRHHTWQGEPACSRRGVLCSSQSTVSSSPQERILRG